MKRSNFFTRYFKENGGIIIALILLCIFFTINSDAFLTKIGRAHV